MGGQEDRISILEQRRIEAGIIKPIYEILVREMGKERAQAVIGEAVREAALATGRSFAAQEASGTNLERFAALLPLWAKGDAYDMELLAQTREHFEFNITRCGYAEMYHAMGVGDIGHLLSCQRDGLFCEGYDPRIRLSRTQTIMQGASHCDFRYSFTPAINLGDVLEAGRDPDKTVLIDGGTADARHWTARELDRLFDSVARGLLARGLRRGDAVGVLSLNRAEFVAVYFGAMRAGLVVVPISWKLPAETIAYIARDADVKLFFADAERGRLVPHGLPVIGLDTDQWSSFLRPGDFESVTPGPDEVAQVLYTSGSTGRPKGVPLSHQGQHWAVEALSGEDVSGHRLLVAAPMFHMNALLNLKFAFHNGACVVLLPAFSAPSCIAAMEAHHVTWLTSVPTMLAMIAKEIGDGASPGAFLAVTKVFMGSSPFGQGLLDGVRRMFPNATITNSYGTTEAGPAVFGKHPDGRPTPDLSMGYPLPGVGVRILEPQRHPIDGPGEGVLEMRTPALMAGYLHLPEQTARVIRDGWYHSSDIVRRDADGFYYFVGRADDMFVSGGENVYPGEVEKMLERHPAVQQAVVVPIPDDVKQQLPFAFIVRQPGVAVDEGEIKRWALENGPAFQHPRWIVFLDALPLAGTNKVDRAALAGLARDLTARGGSSSPTAP